VKRAGPNHPCENMIQFMEENLEIFGQGEEKSFTFSRKIIKLL
jgi:hypothetical protein